MGDEDRIAGILANWREALARGEAVDPQTLLTETRISLRNCANTSTRSR